MCQRKFSEAVAIRLLVELEVRKVLLAYSEFTAQLLGHSLAELNVIVELQVLGALHGLAVDIYYLVFYFKRVAGESHAALYVVLAAVDRAVHYLAQCIGVLPRNLKAVGIMFLIQCICLFGRHFAYEPAVFCTCLVELAVICGSVLLDNILVEAFGITYRVKVNHFGACCREVACGVVEYNDVAKLNLLKSGHTLIVPLHCVDVALAAQ